MFLTKAANLVFFSADDGANGRELWQSNGTEAGTQLVDDINPGSGSAHPENIGASAGLLFFSAEDGLHGKEPWALTFYRNIYLPQVFMSTP